MGLLSMYASVSFLLKSEDDVFLNLEIMAKNRAKSLLMIKKRGKYMVTTIFLYNYLHQTLNLVLK